MIKDFLLKQMLKAQLSKLPKDQQHKALEAFEKNPKIFQEIAQAVQQRVKNGESQMNAVMAVVGERQAELQSLLKA